MLGEKAVRRRAAPISSAMEWKRFLKISSSIGSRRMRRSVPQRRRSPLVVGRGPTSFIALASSFCIPNLERLAPFEVGCGQRPTTNDQRRVGKEFLRSMHNCVDTTFILPQYLVLRTLPVLEVGLRLRLGSVICENPLQGKIVHGGSFMATKKKAKKKKH